MRTIPSTFSWPLLLRVFIPCCVVGYFSFLTRNYQLDDALIYLRYIKNFHDGLGLVYNPGENFNGLTSPLFTFISLLTSFLFRDLQLNTTIISSVFLACASILGGKIFSKSQGEALFTSVVIASFGFFYSTFGMETPLFLMLMALSLYLYRVDSEYFIIALALMVITRSEGSFLAASLAAAYLIQHKRLPNLKIVALALSIFLVPFVFNYFYYGDWLPASSSAKIGQGKSGLWDSCCGFLNAGYLIKHYFSGSTLAALIFLFCSACGAFITRKDQATYVIVAFLVLLLCFYVGLNIPNYSWYYAPFFFLLLILACRGIWGLSTYLLANGGLLNVRTLLFLTLCSASMFVLINTVSFQEKGRHEWYAQIGKWIKTNTPPDATIAAVEIGTIGWHSERQIIDILGLVNRHNADLVAKRDLYGWLHYYQPDYILIHSPIWIGEKAGPTLADEGIYSPLTEFGFPGYVLLKKSGKYTDAEIANAFRVNE